MLIVSIRFFFLVFIFRKFTFHRPILDRAKTNNTPPVSVIICAKNESENLQANLHHIHEQEYPDFEIVLINDASSDDTAEVMDAFAMEHTNIKVVHVANTEVFWGNKKYALTLGIKSASYDHLLFTDADCRPVSKYWIANMVNGFSDSNTIVLGYSPYQYKKGSLINVIIRFETLLTAVQYYSYAMIGLPYMGVGRNMAYHRSAFNKSKGFVTHMHLLSGDDDLFVNQNATRYNVSCCFTPDSFVVSAPKESFLEWFRQKRRHVTTAAFYKSLHKRLLAVFYLSGFLYWFFIGVLLFNRKFTWEVLVLILFFHVIQFIFYKKAFAKLGDKKMWWATPLLEGFLISAQFSIFIANRISKPKYWK
ncbi:glycosyltransferase [Ascidiimonas aurantiaca]|uniref:glycosyltransferase n=1 Tax=Ascidiimonas aurantiaca TaxID=1685432 RepID=UPI0030EDA6F0